MDLPRHNPQQIYQESQNQYLGKINQNNGNLHCICVKQYQLSEKLPVMHLLTENNITESNHLQFGR